MRILAIDYGTKRLGIAISDPLLMSAQAYPYLENNPEIFKKLEELIKKLEITKIILGNPLNMNGTISQKSAEVQVFAEKLKNRINLEIILCDERLSTKAAERHLIFADVSRKKRKEKIDSLAAVFILQGYLDKLSFQSSQIIEHKNKEDSSKS